MVCLEGLVWLVLFGRFCLVLHILNTSHVMFNFQDFHVVHFCIVCIFDYLLFACFTTYSPTFEKCPNLQGSNHLNLNNFLSL